MGGALQVDPAGYLAASSTIGTRVAGTARSAGDGLTETLSGCGAMAGSDPAGTSWASGYDAAVSPVRAATQDAINAALQLAGLLEQTGFNYSLSENASVPGGGAPPPLDTSPYAAQHVTLDPLPPAAGYTDPSLPGQWSLVQSAVGRVWPNGHQDRLRAAASAWNGGARFLYDASFEVADAVASIAQQVSPEVDDAITACNGLRDGLENLADAYNAVSVACESYAGDLDDAHHRAAGELTSLVEWMAGIEIAGALISVISFGAGEVVAQSTVLARIAVTGARIAAIIDRLTALACEAVEAIAALADRAAMISRGLEPLLAADRVVVTTSRAAKATEITATTRAADDALIAAAQRTRQLPVVRRFRNRGRLIKHFDDHAHDFAAASPEDYQRQAVQFLERARTGDLQVKIDAAGTVRVFDPATNSFAVCTSDGTILTYFKPSSPSYWARQPGS
ncbi:MAG: hypothetical protein ACRDWT_03130 [Jatrophihabitantaceae bacterium]